MCGCVWDGPKGSGEEDLLVVSRALAWYNSFFLSFFHYFTISVLLSSSAEYCNYIAARQPGHDETESSGTRQSRDQQNERSCEMTALPVVPLWLAVLGLAVALLLAGHGTKPNDS